MIDTSQDKGIGLYVIRGEHHFQSDTENDPCAHGMTYDSPDGTLEWIHTSKIQNYPLVEDLPILLPMVLQIQPGDPPFSALYTYNLEDQLEITFG
jgi:hypothetical protein